ncbi:CPBP family intramembrane glutamic endopeptidase [Rhodococcus sp. NPDC059234]|uniref:CPBP family intramembrane glutamic endopeptidase n=1 Tax=Rhodococcus sp. NPDC059234 TaxID=3346781 RepID=UPI00366A5D6F
MDIIEALNLAGSSALNKQAPENTSIPSGPAMSIPPRKRCVKRESLEPACNRPCLPPRVSLDNNSARARVPVPGATSVRRAGSPRYHPPMTHERGDVARWRRPSVWLAIGLLVAYLVFYLLVARLITTIFSDRIDKDNVLSSASSILLGVALPIAIGAIALLVVATRLGMLGKIFGRQPIRGRGWMWIGPGLVLAAIIAHLTGTEWNSWTGGQIVAMFVLGACVGVTEELATRGLAVQILRDARHGERFVAVVSSLLFALMHTVNLISGMALSTVGATVVYTFAFGMCMYLAMRVTGTIWAAIVLHALTDPTTFLSSGGLDKAVGSTSAGGAIAALVTIALIAFGAVAAFLVRGTVRTPEDSPAA